MENREKLDQTLDPSRDFNLEYLGVKTLETSHLLRTPKGDPKGELVETPQMMYLVGQLEPKGMTMLEPVSC